MTGVSSQPWTITHLELSGTQQSACGGLKQWGAWGGLGCWAASLDNQQPKQEAVVGQWQDQAPCSTSVNCSEPIDELAWAAKHVCTQQLCSGTTGTYGAAVASAYNAQGRRDAQQISQYVTDLAVLGYTPLAATTICLQLHAQEAAQTCI